MWTRYIIECGTCQKLSNLRLQIPEKERMPISFECGNCKSEISGTLLVDFKKPEFNYESIRGKVLEDAKYDDGDNFVEFSDTIKVAKPSTRPHNLVLPTLRTNTGNFKKSKQAKDLRKLQSDEDWQDLKDLCKVYPNNKPAIKTLSYRILERIYPKHLYEIKIEPDYRRNFFMCLNYFVFLWIDKQNHKAYIDYLSKELFGVADYSDAEINGFTSTVLGETRNDKIIADGLDLIRRWIELREYFHYVVHDTTATQVHASLENFTALKNFYTDCFELIGREGDLVFRCQNISERGTQDSIPPGCPKNVTDADSFKTLDNGRKLDIINLSANSEPKSIFVHSFKSKLRNGINHNKAKFDVTNQIIKYYPITKRPDEEHQISYIEFLTVTLDSFNSVLKLLQLTKMRSNYIYFKEKNGH